MEKSQVSKILLAVLLSMTLLAGCENLPGTPEQQGAVIGGAAGAVAGSSIGDGGAFAILLGGALGAGAGYLLGANRDKLFGNDRTAANRSIQGAQSNPATPDDVRRSATADLNNDGFVTTDELLAMEDAGLNDGEQLRRLRATNQVFDLSLEQENRLARQGISRNVLRQMRDINRAERERLVNSRQQGEIIGH